MLFPRRRRGPADTPLCHRLRLRPRPGEHTDLHRQKKSTDDYRQISDTPMRKHQRAAMLTLCDASIGDGSDGLIWKWIRRGYMRPKNRPPSTQHLSLRRFHLKPAPPSLA